MNDQMNDVINENEGKSYPEWLHVIYQHVIHEDNQHPFDLCNGQVEPIEKRLERWRMMFWWKRMMERRMNYLPVSAETALTILATCGSMTTGSF